MINKYSYIILYWKFIFTSKYDKLSKNMKRFSDQKEYYLKHLKKQRKAMKNPFSMLGRHHNNLDSFIQKEVNSFPKDSHILDAGCGLSAWTTNALRKKFIISGVDGEPDAISACKILYKNQDYQIGDLYNLKYKNNTFDAIVMREVIEHFIFPEKAVKEIYRILKPGGKIIITTPNYDSLLLHFIENTYNRFFGGTCKPYKHEVHPSKFKPSSLTKLINKYFTSVKLSTIDMGISQTLSAIKA